jgi:hypothetical protein
VSNALDAFRAQQQAVEQVHGRLVEVAELLQRLQEQVNAITQNQALREILREEQSWLERAQCAIDDVRTFRKEEMRRFWPTVRRRGVVAAGVMVLTALAAAAGYASAARPYEAELSSLRKRVELLDTVAQRVLTMTPAERRQLDALMKWKTQPTR